MLTLRLPRPAAPNPVQQPEQHAADELSLRRRVTDRAVS